MAGANSDHVKLRDALLTGPTGTNVGDIYLMISLS